MGLYFLNQRALPHIAITNPTVKVGTSKLIKKRKLSLKNKLFLKSLGFKLKKC